MNACGYALLEIAINYQTSSSNHIHYGLVRNGPPEGGTYGPVDKVFSLQTWGSEFIFPKTPKQQDIVVHFCNFSVPIDKRESDTGRSQKHRDCLAWYMKYEKTQGTISDKVEDEPGIWVSHLTFTQPTWLSHTNMTAHIHILHIHKINYKYIPALANFLFYWLIVFKKYHVTPKLSFYVERHKRYECVYFIHIYEWNILFHIYMYIYTYMKFLIMPLSLGL